MMNVHISPSKRRARPTGWVAHVSNCSVVCGWSVVFIVQVYYIFSLKNNILDNRKFLLYTYFRKESVDGKSTIRIGNSLSTLAILIQWRQRNDYLTEPGVTHSPPCGWIDDRRTQGAEALWLVG